MPLPRKFGVTQQEEMPAAMRQSLLSRGVDPEPDRPAAQPIPKNLASAGHAAQPEQGS